MDIKPIHGEILNPKQTRLYYQNDATARFSALMIVCIGSFLVPVSLAASLVAIPAIATDLAANAVYVSWIPAAFLLSNLIVLLPAGRAADIYGCKSVYQWGSVTFLLGSIVAGLSQNIEWLLFARIIQGAGAGMFFGTGLAIVGNVYQDGGRGAALGWVVACVYSGLSVGPLLGGWLTDSYGWPSVFFSMVPFILASILLTLLKLKGDWRNDDPQRLDWKGSIILSCGLIVFFIGVTNLPEIYAFALLLVSVALGFSYMQHSERVDFPIVNLKLVWQNHKLSRSLVASILMYGGSYGLQFLIGLYLQYNRGYSPTDAGKFLLIQALVMAVIAPVAGRLSDRYQPNMIAASGCLTLVLSFVLMMFLDDDSHIAITVISLALLGAGFGLFSTPNSNASLQSISVEKLGIVSALVSMSRLVGQLASTAFITLMMSLYIGNAEIVPSNYGALLEVFRWTIGMSLVCAAFAAYISISVKRA